MCTRSPYNVLLNKIIIDVRADILTTSVEVVFRIHDVVTIISLVVTSFQVSKMSLTTTENISLIYLISYLLM